MAGAERRAVTESVRHARVGVIDIGSNSIRLVVYDAPVRAFIPIYNEKAMCGLGKGLARRGRLPPEGMALALDTVRRFVELARAMSVGRLDVIATAAVREALDGSDFVKAVERRCGVRVEVLSGMEEGRLSALGVMSDLPKADGVIGDLGGGSLELVSVENGRIGEQATLPLGPLRLLDETGGDLRQAETIIDHELTGVPWLAGRAKGRRFYAVGGAWRSLARVHMAQTDYPLHVIDRYEVKRSKMENIVTLVARMGRRSLERLPGVPRRRLDTLPMAAFVMERILRVGGPKRVVFSAHGLREGMVFSRLSADAQREDPLLAACAAAAQRFGRFAEIGGELGVWTAPLFPKESAEDERLRRAACWLGDIGWIDHPDYRAQQALERVLRLSVLAADHPGRAFLGLVAFYRYGGQAADEVADIARGLVAEGAEKRARVLGLALRLGYAITGGAPGILGDMTLGLDGDRLNLVVAPSREALVSDDVNRRFQAVAAALDRKTQIVPRGERKAAGF